MVAPVRRPTRRVPRPLPEKLAEIHDRSPKDYAALEVLADEVLARLDAADRQAGPRPGKRR